MKRYANHPWDQIVKHTYTQKHNYCILRVYRYLNVLSDEFLQKLGRLHSPVVRPHVDRNEVNRRILVVFQKVLKGN